MTPEETLRALDKALAADRRRLERYDAYYEGRQPLRYMAPALEAEIGDRITQLVINWPRIGADAYENRLDIEGFRYSRDASADDAIWDLWQANDGDEQSQQAHLESLVSGRCYVIVGSGDSPDDPPVFTVEHPLQVITSRDPRTRKTTAGLKRWRDEDGKTQRAALYLPESTVRYVKRGRDWVADDRDDHELGRVLVVPLVNRGRLLRPLGVSEFHDVIPVADAANKMATDMMVSGEFHAMPRRWVFGMTAEDFEDENGQALSTWSMIAGRIWATDKRKDEVAVGQFPESDLAVFHQTIKLLAQIASQVLALPPHYMSFTGDNPASADAIRSSESQLVKRAERKQTALEGGWEDVVRLMLRILTGEWSDQARSLDTMWRDPSTPTVAQKADAAVKLAGNRPILPVEQVREDLGYTPEQRRRMREMDDREQRALMEGLGVKPVEEDEEEDPGEAA